MVKSHQHKQVRTRARTRSNWVQQQSNVGEASFFDSESTYNLPPPQQGYNTVVVPFNYNAQIRNNLEICGKGVETRQKVQQTILIKRATKKNEVRRVVNKDLGLMQLRKSSTKEQNECSNDNLRLLGMF